MLKASLLRALGALMLTVVCALTAPAPVMAQEPDIFGDEGGGAPAGEEDLPGMEEEDGGDDVPEVGDEPRAQEVEPLSQNEANQRMRDYVASNSDKITINQIVGEMIDDFTADAKELNLAAISPMAIRGVAVTPNLSSGFADLVHS